MCGLAALCACSQTAESALAPVIGKLNGGKSVTVQFRTQAGDAATAGSLTQMRECFKMHTPQLSAWYDGRTLWTYNDGARETSVTEPTADELMEINPFDILNNYQKRFSTRVAHRSAASTTVEFTPKAKGGAIKAAVMTLSNATKMPQAIDLTFSNGTKMRIAVTSVTEGKAQAKGAFTYPAGQYPNVEIIDLR